MTEATPDLDKEIFESRQAIESCGYDQSDFVQ